MYKSLTILFLYDYDGKIYKIWRTNNNTQYSIRFTDDYAHYIIHYKSNLNYSSHKIFNPP